MSKSKRFQKTRIVGKYGGIYDSKTDKVLSVNDVEHKLNEQESVIDEQNRRIRKLENILKKFQFPVERV